ncbi:MAG: PKD domain-containing protein [Saprospiraceae bacterium]|nr:PKD domain-containing protein [Saprospiraceae bacterium]
MRPILTILAAIIIGSFFLPQQLKAQIPQKMSFQAVIRNTNNQLVTNQTVGMQISILQASVTGTVVYIETQTTTTNDNGLITIEIGGQSGFDTINWANGPYYLKTETDPTGGTNYTIKGTSQLLSVPYSLYSENINVDFSKAGDTLFIGKKFVIIPGLSAANPFPVADFTANKNSVIKGQSVDFSDNSLGNPATWYWNFQGASPSSSNLQNPSGIIYNTAGTYDVKLTVANMNGTDSIIKTAFISVVDLPAVNCNGILYVHPSDNSSSIQWGGMNITTGATSNTNGEQNTQTIVDTLGIGNYAACLCDTLTAYGFTDWYLPAKDELNCLYQNRISIGGFTTGAYYSSTEFSSTHALYQIFINGAQYSTGKGASFIMRCVRRD